MADDPTTGWYNVNAAEFTERTQSLDMSHLYGPFLEHLPLGGKILDAGCGAGRDSKAFLERGYDVTLLDASAELAKAAEALTGRPVQIGRFQEIDWLNKFDGIWACASLLHVPEGKLPEVFERLARALKPSGLLYASLKEGNGERIDRKTTRHFTYVTEISLARLVEPIQKLETLRIWTNEDSRGEQQPPWVNGLFRRQVKS